MTTVKGGVAEGPLIAGNLSVLTRLIGTAYEPDWNDAILCVEDICEYYYAIDRLFLHLRQSRLAPRIGGLVLGEFIDNQDNETPWGESVEQIAANHFPNIPIATGLPIGHGAKNTPLVIGRPCALSINAAGATLNLPAHSL
jgi:muramoyltetrapeptide carboxypeptidase